MPKKPNNGKVAEITQLLGDAEAVMLRIRNNLQQNREPIASDVDAARGAITRLDHMLKEGENTFDAVYNQRLWQWNRMKPQLESLIQQSIDPVMIHTRKANAATTPIGRRKHQKSSSHDDNDHHHRQHSQENSETDRQRHLVYSEEQTSEERRKELARLHREIEAVHDLQRDIHHATAESGERLAEVDANVSKSDDQTKKGLKEMIKASKYKFAAGALGLMGAVAGGVVAGPVGAAVGVKGGLGLAGCIVAGAATGGVVTSKVGQVIHHGNVRSLTNVDEVRHIKENKGGD
eukprot:PhM_4_TR6230/c0_g1_i1/m.41582